MDYSAGIFERATCPEPFLAESDYANSTGYINGRLCANLGSAECCLPCPFSDWVYPDNFKTLNNAAGWIAVISTVLCVFLLSSWAALPVDKTHRHYLSICLTVAVIFMNLGFVIPLAGRADQCADSITPNSMASNHLCGASGGSLILGGWGGVMWVFMRSMSLHLQICWQVVVGRNFMWFAQVVGWGVPILGTILALVFSGVSFRLGATCHINHTNSLADLWIPLLVFAGMTIVIQLSTFAYCIKVYLASLADNSESTEGSGLPSYSNSIRTLTPRQAYRRVRRVIQLQWRGIAIVMIICADVILFSIVFVFQDNTVSHLKADPSIALEWLTCLAVYQDKDECLSLASSFTVNEATVGAVLILLSMNGFWLVILLGRWSMVLGWVDLFTPATYRNNKREFVSVDARLEDVKKDPRSYEMLSRGASSAGRSANKDGVVTTISSTAGPKSTIMSPSSPNAPGSPRAPRIHGSNQPGSPLMSLDTLASFGSNGPAPVDLSAAHTRTDSNDNRSSGRRTPDYFGQSARYKAPARSFSIPRPPESTASSVRWDPQETFAPSRSARSPPPRTRIVRSPSQDTNSRFEGMDPLGMNRI